MFSYHKKTGERHMKLLGWDILPHPQYSPNLVPSDYHLSASMGHMLAEQHFSNFEDVGRWLNEWLPQKKNSFSGEMVKVCKSRWPVS